jgi:hypothetical protein
VLQPIKYSFYVVLLWEFDHFQKVFANDIVGGGKICGDIMLAKQILHDLIVTRVKFFILLLLSPDCFIHA